MKRITEIFKQSDQEGQQKHIHPFPSVVKIQSARPNTSPGYPEFPTTLVEALPCPMEWKTSSFYGPCLRLEGLWLEDYAILHIERQKFISQSTMVLCQQDVKGRPHFVQQQRQKSGPIQVLNSSAKRQVKRKTCLAKISDVIL